MNTFKIGDVIEVVHAGDYFICLVSEKPSNVTIYRPEEAYVWTEDYSVEGKSQDGYWLLTEDTGITIRILDPAEWMITVMRGYYVPNR